MIDSNRLIRMLVMALGVATALVLPAGAQAATTCSFNGDLLFVEMSADGDIAHLEIGGGGVILVDGASGPVICGPDGPPTVTNTETVAIVDSSDAPSTPPPTDGTTRVEIVEPSAFVPGATLNGEGGGPRGDRVRDQPRRGRGGSAAGRREQHGGGGPLGDRHVRRQLERRRARPGPRRRSGHVLAVRQVGVRARGRRRSGQRPGRRGDRCRVHGIAGHLQRQRQRHDLGWLR